MLDATTTTFRTVSLTFTIRPASNPPRMTRPTLILLICVRLLPEFSAAQHHPRGRRGALLPAPPRAVEPGAQCSHGLLDLPAGPADRLQRLGTERLLDHHRTLDAVAAPRLFEHRPEQAAFVRMRADVRVPDRRRIDHAADDEACAPAGTLVECFGREQIRDRSAGAALDDLRQPRD